MKIINGLAHIMENYLNF